MSGYITCLMHNVGKSLRIVAVEATDLVVHTLGCEHALNQRGELVRYELASE